MKKLAYVTLEIVLAGMLVSGCAFEDIKNTVRGLYISDNVETVDDYSLCNYEKLEVLIWGENFSDIPKACIMNNPNL